MTQAYENASPAPGPLALSRLESLPPELRHYVLECVPDLPTLRSMVQASPTIHAQYRFRRHGILSACLERDLGGCSVDAYASMMSRDQPRLVLTDENIVFSVGIYRSWISGSAPYHGLRSVDLPSLCWMAAFHIRVVRPLAFQFSSWAIENLEELVSDSTIPLEESGAAGSAAAAAQKGVSNTEMARILKALYRHETFNQLFGQLRSRRSGGFCDAEINQIFLDSFDPWDVEVIGCIQTFFVGELQSCPYQGGERFPH